MHSGYYLAPLIKQNVLQIILGNDNNCKNHKKERDWLTRSADSHGMHHHSHAENDREIHHVASGEDPGRLQTTGS